MQTQNYLNFYLMSFELQQTIRNNAKDLKEYVSDLYDWEQEMEAKEKVKARQRELTEPQRRAQMEAKRKEEEQQARKQQEAASKQTGQRKKDLIRDANTVQDYYKAWDQFDPDQQIKKLEEEESKAYKPYNPYEDSKNYQRAKPKAKMVVKGSRNAPALVKDPTSLKDKGNLHFKVCEYERAIDCYTECLKKVQEEENPDSESNRKLKAVVLSNRAMALMKINERARALADCNESLENDPKYMKTYLRRADCLKKLGKYKESLADFKMVKSLAPSEVEADQEIKKIQEFLKKRVKQTQEGMIVSSIPAVIPGGYRLQIEEVEAFEEEAETAQEEEQKVNYLEQL